jgi:hypothetical protein
MEAKQVYVNNVDQDSVTPLLVVHIVFRTELTMLYHAQLQTGRMLMEDVIIVLARPILAWSELRAILQCQKLTTTITAALISVSE